MKLMNRTRIMQDRKGMWTQIFLIGFFVLLVVVSLILLSMDVNRNTFDSKRKFLDQDLQQQQTDATLISLLRSPVTVDGKTMMLANLIVMNEDGKHDDLVYSTIESRLKPSGVYSMSILSSHSLKITPPKKLITTADGQGQLSYVVLALSKTYLPGTSANIEVDLIKYNATSNEQYDFTTETVGAKVQTQTVNDLQTPKQSTLADAVAIKPEGTQTTQASQPSTK